MVYLMPSTTSMSTLGFASFPAWQTTYGSVKLESRIANTTYPLSKLGTKTVSHADPPSVWVHTKYRPSFQIRFQFLKIDVSYLTSWVQQFLSLALKRGQVIIFVNDGLVYWRIYASRGLNWLFMVNLQRQVYNLFKCGVRVGEIMVWLNLA